MTFTKVKNILADMPNMLIANTVKRFRLERDLTYAQLGVLTGMSGSHMFRIEKGLCKLHDRTLHKLAKLIPELKQFETGLHPGGQSETTTDDVGPPYETLKAS